MEINNIYTQIKTTLLIGLPCDLYFLSFVMDVEIVGETQGSEREDEDCVQSGSIIRKHYKVNGVQSRKDGEKNVACIFCDTVFVGSSSSWAFAHILGRSVLEQEKSNGKPCIPMCQDGDIAP